MERYQTHQKGEKLMKLFTGGKDKLKSDFFTLLASLVISARNLC